MNGAAEVKPTPVSPSVIDVPDLAAACAALGLPPPPKGTTTMELELLPGCVVAIAEVEGPPTPFVYLCVSNLTAARRQLEATVGTAQWGPDTVDPDTSRIRGCLLRGGGMVIDAVHCRRSEEAGVPCGEDCSPFLSFD